MNVNTEKLKVVNLDYKLHWSVRKVKDLNSNIHKTYIVELFPRVKENTLVPLSFYFYSSFQKETYLKLCDIHTPKFHISLTIIPV